MAAMPRSPSIVRNRGWLEVRSALMVCGRCRIESSTLRFFRGCGRGLPVDRARVRYATNHPSELARCFRRDLIDELRLDAHRLAQAKPQAGLELTSVVVRKCGRCDKLDEN